MAVLFFWSFMTYGMTSIIVWGSIFETLREYIKTKSELLYQLLTCMLCTGTWVGFIMSAITGGVSNLIYDNLNIFVCIFLDGMFTAGVVWFINTISEFLEEYRIK